MLSEEGNVKRDQQALRWAKQLERSLTRVCLYDSLVDLLGSCPQRWPVEMEGAIDTRGTAAEDGQQCPGDSGG